VAFGGEPGYVFGVSDNGCCTVRSDPIDIRQRRSRRLNCHCDPLPRRSRCCVEPGDIANQLSGNQDPISDRLTDDTDTVKKLRCVAGTDLHTNTTRLELKEQRVETRAVLLRSLAMSRCRFTNKPTPHHDHQIPPRPDGLNATLRSLPTVHHSDRSSTTRPTPSAGPSTPTRVGRLTGCDKLAGNQIPEPIPRLDSPPTRAWRTGQPSR
jgi:hypothetical protein